MALTGLAVTRLKLLPPHSDSRVRRLALAIATAEGFWKKDSLPRRLNNPGSLKDQYGNFRAFVTEEEGWRALYRQIELMLSGKSKWYRPDMTIAEVARYYTATEQSIWASNVAKTLGVSVDTKIEDV